LRIRSIDNSAYNASFNVHGNMITEGTINQARLPPAPPQTRLLFITTNQTLQFFNVKDIRYTLVGGGGGGGGGNFEGSGRSSTSGGGGGAGNVHICIDENLGNGNITLFVTVGRGGSSGFFNNNGSSNDSNWTYTMARSGFDTEVLRTNNSNFGSALFSARGGARGDKSYPSFWTTNVSGSMSRPSSDPAGLKLIESAQDGNRSSGVAGPGGTGQLGSPQIVTGTTFRGAGGDGGAIAQGSGSRTASRGQFGRNGLVILEIRFND